MKILLVGSGGREHAIAWKLSQDERVEKIFVAPGNAGTQLENKCENIIANDNDELLKFAIKNKIDLTIVGPEQPLEKGIVDLFRNNNLKIFGPNKNSAQLETSKSFAKEFMIRNKIATAKYEKFSDYEKAKEYINNVSFPIVIKADGLAAGKGVVICKEKSEALDALKKFMVDDIFAGGGKLVVVEEFLEGVEASIICACDNYFIAPFISCKDHKTIYENNRGPNTGGMGVISPNPYFTKKIEKKFNKKILKPTIKGLQKDGIAYSGFIFFGVMITKKECKLLEFNVRMGDPETQSILSLMKTSLLNVILASLDNKLSSIKIEWLEQYCINVVLASLGYPGKYKTGYEIKVDKNLKSKIFYAGAIRKKSKTITSGGRVLSVVSNHENKFNAIQQVYEDIEKVNFKNKVYRKDIGQ